MDADAPAMNRQVERNAAAESAPRAGHEHGRGFVVLSHAVLWKNAWAESNRRADERAGDHSR